MARKLMFITARGKRSQWCFDVNADPKYLTEWQADGLEIYVVENSIPMWVAEAGMTRAWCFLQDVFNFRNPWRR